MNISRTDEAFDMRFLRGAQKCSNLHSDQVSAKSLEPFLRKSRKTPQKCTFSYFMDEPNFFLKIGLRHFFRPLDVQQRAKFRKNR